MKASVSQLPTQSVPTARENGFPDLSTQGASGAFFFLLPSHSPPNSCYTNGIFPKDLCMDAVFYFHFYAQNNDFTPTRSLAFYATNITTPWDELDWKMGYSEGDIEAQYGEHCGLVGLTIESSGTKLIGYSTSKIHEQQRGPLMNVWRATFLEIDPGCVVGEVYDVTDMVGTVDIYRYVKDAYEHQQAQQLRTTLNAHITTYAPPTAIKKI